VRTRQGAACAVAVLAAGTLTVTGIGTAGVESRRAAAAETMRVSVSTVQYDSPGAVVPAIVTVHQVPRDHTATITASGTGGSTVSCVGASWRNPVRQTVSRTCYLRLPNQPGSYHVRGSATVTRNGTSRTVSGLGSRPVRAEGKASPEPMSLATVEQITRCHNTTSDVWLTFDDGGSAAQVNSILTTLRRNNVKALFFFRGDWARSNPALLNKIRSEGHILGNHTSTHRALSADGKPSVFSQIDGGVAATGNPKLLRPPFGAGAFSTRIERYAAQRSYRLCRWTTDTYDWDGPTVDQMVERIVHGDYRSAPIRAGGNILMHGHGKHTAPGLQKIIDAVRGKGLRLMRLR